MAAPPPITTCSGSKVLIAIAIAIPTRPARSRPGVPRGGRRPEQPAPRRDRAPASRSTGPAPAPTSDTAAGRSARADQARGRRQRTQATKAAGNSPSPAEREAERQAREEAPSLRMSRCAARGTDSQWPPTPTRTPSRSRAAAGATSTQRPLGRRGRRATGQARRRQPPRSRLTLLAPVLEKRRRAPSRRMEFAWAGCPAA